MKLQQSMNDVVAFFFQLKEADGYCRKREPTAYLRTIVTG
jgi:hypothetical protein